LGVWGEVTVVGCLAEELGRTWRWDQTLGFIENWGVVVATWSRGRAVHKNRSLWAFKLAGGRRITVGGEDGR
jgi:hypothetical protein